MNKDVIYIDVEDDITAIISKVKSSRNSIVALVPPKRIGVLQSAVNLKLLHKAAHDVDKHVVLITSDHQLLSLAAGIKMPVAKNLQSRPEIPHMEAAEEPKEEVISESSDVKESGRSGGDVPKTPLAAKASLDDLDDKIELTDAEPAKEAGEPAKKIGGVLGKKKGKLRIPDFSSFRAKVFIFGGGGLLLIGFLVWALVIAPHATVTITAKTTGVNVSESLALDPGLTASKVSEQAIKPNVQQLKKQLAVEFDATGTKDFGTKATGSVKIKNCDSTTSFVLSGGTTFVSSGGLKFTSDAQVTVPGFTGSAAVCQSSGTGAGIADVNVTAKDIGPEYNIDPTSFTISGLSGGYSASSSAAMQGGTKEKATVVSQEDVDKAKDQLGQQNVDAVKKELKKQFDSGYVVIDESFIAEPGDLVSSPAVGEKAQKAKLTAETTYTMVAITRQDVQSIITGVVNDALKDQPSQQLFTLGDDAITFQAFRKLDGGKYAAQMVTTSYIGPRIDKDDLKKQISGKRYGEIQALVNNIPSVDEVFIKLSPFWVTTAPGPDKIEINFTVAKNAQ